MVIGQIIRDFIAANYSPTSLDRVPLLLLACAETIERLTRERDEAIGQVEKLLKLQRENLVIERDNLTSELIKQQKKPKHTN